MRALHLLGTCSYAVTYSVVRSLLLFGVISLMFGIDLISGRWDQPPVQPPL